MIRDGTVWYDTATDIWDSLGTDGGGKGVINYLTLQEQKQFGRSWHQMRGWVQFTENMTAKDVQKFFRSGDWMFEVARSSAPNNDQWLETNQYAVSDRWTFGQWLEHTTEPVFVGKARYWITVKEDTSARDTRVKKAAKKKAAYQQKSSWKKGYAQKKFFEGPLVSDDDSEEEASQVFEGRPPIDRDDGQGLQLDFEVSEPEEDSQDDEPLLEERVHKKPPAHIIRAQREAERQGNFDAMEDLLGEMESEEDDEEIDYDDEEQAREDRWDQYQARQAPRRSVDAVWKGWAGVPDWNEGDNDLEVDIMA